MHIVAVHNWQNDDAAVAQTIAATMGTVVFEARQKIAGGGPAVLASFADPRQAEALADRLSQQGVPALVIDILAMRSSTPFLHVRRFVLGPQALLVEAGDGASREIPYGAIDLLLAAVCTVGQMQTTTETQRKFSLGKTLLAGGVPMTKIVKRETVVTAEERDETFWLYTPGGATVVFNRAAMNYDGLGAAMQFTRDLNFAHLKKELRRLAPQAVYDDRLIKMAALVRLLGSTLKPEVDLDLAFEILARSLRAKPVS